MRSKVIRVLALAFVLGSVSLGLAQQPQPGGPQVPGTITIAPRGVLQIKMPKDEKSKLEEMLAEALKNNADIRVAAAKLAEADAELNRTRLQVSQKVVSLHHAILTQKAAVELAQKKCDRLKELLAQKAVSSDLMDEAMIALTLAKAKLTEAEADLAHVLGKSPQAEYMQTIQEARLRREASRLQAIEYEATLLKLREKRPNPSGAMAERIRKALQTPVKVDYKDMTFDAILKDLSKKVDGLVFRNLFQRGGLSEGKMNLRFEQALPVSAILQALADETGCYFFIRDYGIVATNGNNVPHGGMTIEDFLRQKPSDPAAMEKRDEQSPNAHLMWNPPDNIVGTIKQIEPTGMLQILFANVDGLLSGHTLYLYRSDESGAKPKYLGTVRMINVVRGKGKGPNGQESLAQPIGRFTDTPKVGDKVSGCKPSK